MARARRAAIADVAVQDGKIAAVGPKLGAGQARDRRRGPDRGAGLRRHPHALRRPGDLGSVRHALSSWHGVTTTVFGNCGVGFAPVRPGQSGYLINLMEGVEDIPGTVLSEGVKFNWESFPDYLDALASMTRAVDVGGPAAARRAALLRHGRSRRRACRGAERARDRGDGAAHRGGAARRRHGLHHLAHHQAQGPRRPLHALAQRPRGRAAGHRRRASSAPAAA